MRFKLKLPGMVTSARVNCLTNRLYLAMRVYSENQSGKRRLGDEIGGHSLK